MNRAEEETNREIISGSRETNEKTETTLNAIKHTLTQLHDLSQSSKKLNPESYETKSLLVEFKDKILPQKCQDLKILIE